MINQLSLTKSQKQQRFNIYKDFIHSYLTRVQDKPKNTTRLHVVSIIEGQFMNPIEFMNKMTSSMGYLIDNEFISVDLSNKAEHEFMIFLDKFIRGSFNKGDNVVLVVEDGIILTVINVKSKGKSKVTSKGFA